MDEQQQLMTEDVKEAIKDRFRVIELKNYTEKGLEDTLNKHGNEGFGVYMLFEGMIIMHRVVNLVMPGMDQASQGAWSVPGAEGSA